MKKYLSTFFACCSLLAMLGATGLRLVQARSMREDDSRAAVLKTESEPKIHSFKYDHRIEWTDATE